MINNVSRKANLGGEFVFVDGQPGCGKTLISRLLGTFERVELLSYIFEIEFSCALAHLGKIDLEAAQTLIRLQSDMKLYNTMMGRDVNCRPSDLSSIFNHHDPMLYLKRFLEPGDEAVPNRISEERPILNLAVHNLLPFSETLWKALGDRCFIIEVVRHPLYMLRQQALNFENLIEDKRDLHVYFSYGERELPYYIKGWEEDYIKSNPMERVILNMQHLSLMTNEVKREIKPDFNCRVLTIPFELFVLEPLHWLEKISDFLGVQFTEATYKVMYEQNIPRTKISEGIDLDIYRRCGWVPPVDGASERDELMIRRKDAENNASPEVLAILDTLSRDYEDLYWKPDSS